MEIERNDRRTVGQWNINGITEVSIRKVNDQEYLDIVMASPNTDYYLLQLILQFGERRLITNETPVQAENVDNATIRNLFRNENDITVGRVIRTLDPSGANKLPNVQRLRFL